MSDSNSGPALRVELPWIPACRRRRGGACVGLRAGLTREAAECIEISELALVLGASRDLVL